MYGINDLKEKIEVSENKVECPVKGCEKWIPKQRKTFKAKDEFKCQKHKIFISPSTFEYEEEKDNLLWYELKDKKLFDKIKKVKRESRIVRDNSEDAVSWNIFRFLDREKLLIPFLNSLSNKKIKFAELIFWSYSAKENATWSWLNKARIEFGESIARGSEPDIIIITDKILYFIEAKLTASNKTQPSVPQNRKKYESGGNNHFINVFSSDYETLANKNKKYELMRFWLLGTWIAKELKLDFNLISLLCKGKEEDLETDFKQHISLTTNNQYLRLNWEDIYDYIISIPESKAKKTMCHYFQNKTIGYSAGKLKRAFQINKNRNMQS